MVSTYSLPSQLSVEADLWPDPPPMTTHEHVLLVEALMNRLLRHPSQQLTITDNNALMRIFESYRHMVVEIQSLHEHINQECTALDLLQHNHLHAKNILEEKLAQSKNENERLESIIAAYNSTSIWPTRHSSVLHKRTRSTDDKKLSETRETDLEFLDHLVTSANRNMSNQRAYMRTRAIAAVPDTPVDAASTLARTLAVNSQHPSTENKSIALISTPPSPTMLRRSDTTSSVIRSMKQPQLRKQTSALFGRLRQQQVDTESSPSRHFSFDVGDDASPISKQSYELAKSASPSSMTTQIKRQRTPLTIIMPNSRSSLVNHGEVRRLSKIPSPIFQSGAKPRHDSKSSDTSNVTILQDLPSWSPLR